MTPQDSEALSNPSELDQLALESMALRQHDELVAYRQDGGIDVFRFIEIGETRLRTFKVGKDGPSMSFEMKVADPLLEAEYNSLADYVQTLPDRRSGWDFREQIRENAIQHDEEFDGLAQSILGYAKQKAEQSDSEAERYECCPNCEGEQRSFKCFCMEGGSTYTDVEGETVEQRPKGEPDPDCVRCEGNGNYTPNCPTCRGNGEVIINPLVTLINDETGATSSFRFEFAEMLREGRVDLRISEEDRPFRRRNDIDQLALSVDFRPLMAANASEIGIDIYSEGYFAFWGGRPIELWGSTFGHLLRPVEINVPAPGSDTRTLNSLEELFKQIEARAWRSLRSDIYGLDEEKASIDNMHKLGNKFDIQFDERLLVKEYGLRLGSIMPAHQALQELINILGQYDYRLGFAYTGIATGETGPALYILDHAGNVLQEIDSGYEERIVLETSRRAIKAAHEKGEIKALGDSEEL